MILRSWDKQVLDGYNKAETLLLSCYPSPVAWQITLRSAEKKKEPGASEDESDEDLCILIFGSLLHSDKVVSFISRSDEDYNFKYSLVFLSLKNILMMLQIVSGS